MRAAAGTCLVALALVACTPSAPEPRTARFVGPARCVREAKEALESGEREAVVRMRFEECKKDEAESAAAIAEESKPSAPSAKKAVEPEEKGLPDAPSDAKVANLAMKLLEAAGPSCPHPPRRSFIRLGVVLSTDGTVKNAAVVASSAPKLAPGVCLAERLRKMKFAAFKLPTPKANVFLCDKPLLKDCKPPPVVTPTETRPYFIEVVVEESGTTTDLEATPDIELLVDRYGSTSPIMSGGAVVGSFGKLEYWWPRSSSKEEQFCMPSASGRGRCFEINCGALEEIKGLTRPGGKGAPCDPRPSPVPDKTVPVP